jgi:hypothetical protein
VRSRNGVALSAIRLLVVWRMGRRPAILSARQDEEGSQATKATAPGGYRVPLSPQAPKRARREYSTAILAHFPSCSQVPAHLGFSRMAEGGEMRTYYRGPEVLITDQVFAILAPYPAAFRVDELYNVRVFRGELHPARVFTAHAAGGAILAVAASWPLIHSLLACVGALVLVATPCVISGACSRLAPRTYALRATYRNLDVQLYCSADLTTFGQVRRGLLRALEARQSRLEQVGASAFR